MKGHSIEKPSPKLFVVIGVLVILGLSILSTILEFRSDEVATSIEAAETPKPRYNLVLQDNSYAINSIGTVQASQISYLAPTVSGKVVKLHPQFIAGEIFTKGASLLEIQQFEYKSRLADAQAQLEQARLDVANEQAEALKAVKRTYSSVNKKGQNSDLVLRVPHRRAVNARLKAAEAKVQEAEQMLEDTVLIAPYDCQLIEVSIGVAARVEAGQTVGKIIPVSGRIVRFSIPLEEFSALPRDAQGKINTPLIAECKLNNGYHLQWLGQVTAVDSSLDAKGQSAIVIAELQPNTHHVAEWKVAPVNMQLNVQMNVTIPNSTWIPASALRKGTAILVDSVDGTLERSVHVVAKVDDRILVTIVDYKEGDVLVM